MWEKEFKVARLAAERCAVIVNKMFQYPPETLNTEYKEKDGDTPATIIDRTASRELRLTIQESFPDDEILDEEVPLPGTRNGRRWVTDGLDGTVNAEPKFECAVSAISFEYKGEVIITVITNAFEKSVTYAVKNQGAHVVYLRRREDWPKTIQRIQGVNRKSEEFQLVLPQAEQIETLPLLTRRTNNKPPQALRPGKARNRRQRRAELDGLNVENTRGPFAKFWYLLGDPKLASGATDTRTFGSPILAWTHLAQGRVDIALVHGIGGWWDIAPGRLLIPESGKCIFDVDGKLPTPESHAVLACSKKDKDELLKIFTRCYGHYKGFR